MVICQYTGLLYHLQSNITTKIQPYTQYFIHSYGVEYYKRLVIFMDEKAFSLRLAQLREKKGVSARDMSLSIGQNAGYINNIESGKSMPSLSGFFYICEYLGISPSDFFDVNTKNPTRLNELMDDLKRLNDKQLETIAVLVKDIIK